MSVISCKVNGKLSNVSLRANEVSFSFAKGEEILKYKRIINIEDLSKTKKETSIFKIHYACKNKKGAVWKLKKYEISSVENKDDGLERFYTQLSDCWVTATSHRPKKLLTLVNPISGGKYGRKLFTSQVEPLFQLAGIELDVKFSERHHHFTEILNSYDLTQVNGVVVIGGDGTYSEVMTVMLKNKQETEGLNYDDPNCVVKPLDIPIGFIPAGTGNGMATICYDTYDSITATLQIIIGDYQQAPVVGCFSGGRLVAYSGMLPAYGFFGDVIYLTDRKRWLSRARYPIMMMYCILFRPYRQIEGKVTFINREQKEDGTEEIKEEEFTGVFINVMTFPWRLFNAECMKHFGGLDTSTMEACLMRPTSRWGMIQLFKQMFQYDANVEWDHLVFQSVTDLKFEMKRKEGASPEEQKLETILNVDGEVYDLPSPSGHLRIFPDTVRLYTQKTKQDEEAQEEKASGSLCKE